MVTVPADGPPQTNPEDEPTVATEELLLHMPPVSASVNVVQVPVQMSSAPVIAGGVE